MAAGDGQDVPQPSSQLRSPLSPKKRKKQDHDDGYSTAISSADYSCPICLQILFEPVVMPCNHELCRPCFKQNVEEANFFCPLCRMRISSWARKSARDGTLVNCKRWEEIQRLFPVKCQKRLRGEDDEDQLFDHAPPKRTISADGELREEYEAEMRKLQKVREQEMRASEDTIRQLQEEEQKLMRSLEQQTSLDEELARKLDTDARQQGSQERLSQKNACGNTASNPDTKVGKGKKKHPNTNSKSDSHCITLDRWFSPTRKTHMAENQDCKAESWAEPSRSCTPSSSNGDLHCYKFAQLYNEKMEQEKQDFQFALKLQKEFDLLNKNASQVERRKGTADAYLLRGESNLEEIM